MKPVTLATVIVAIVSIVLTVPAVSSLRAAMTAGATASDERAAVERAVADYAKALYEVRSDLIERSVHRELTKRGFFRNDAGEWQENIMTYDDLHALAGEWNVEKRVTAEQSPWRVRVVDVFDQTATALLTADWGIDHMQLAKYDGRWKIIQVLWQIPPQ